MVSWTGMRSHGYDGMSDRYHALADDMDDLRDAEEISIPRHHPQHGRNRNSQHSSSFMTSSSHSTSVKSSRTGSGHNVELGINSSSGGAHHGSLGSPGSAGGGGGGGSGATATGATAVHTTTTVKDDRRDKVGQNVSEDEDEDASSNHDGHHNPGSTEATRAGYQAF
ncbi:hypothetical protein BGZ51_000394 [Haplosporangium sp. Z 767]|nr:hypothetical protein BGZ51_000394 [Haplosporangium sp. Z 767]KAF9188976.1 hypothetical protein BGZ50_001009 [Haplosporangium sp. Z 11]